ncbi:MAG: hypothetical protein QW103_01385 [Candidatus Pacearchaeota archaeon]
MVEKKVKDKNKEKNIKNITKENKLNNLQKEDSKRDKLSFEENKSLEKKEIIKKENIEEDKSKIKEGKFVYTIDEALNKLRAEKKRNFVQTVDLIINLQKIDVRKQSINTFIQVPHSTEKRIAAFLTKKIEGIEVILKEDFDNFKTNRDLKRLAKKYDMFIANASLMKDIAAKFGRFLGPSGKMPSPQLGVVLKEDKESLNELINKMKKSIKIRTKEKSIKVPVGKENMSDEQIKENIESAIQSITELLPLKKDNIKNILVKFTMSKPYEIKYEKK